jgi:hypothetical protein
MKDRTASPPRAIVFGTKVLLKDGVWGDIKIRQWEFSGVEKGKICLYRREGLFLEVGMEDINWDWRGRESLKVEN